MLSQRRVLGCHSSIPGLTPQKPRGLMKSFEQIPLISYHVLSYFCLCTCCSLCLKYPSLPTLPSGFSSGWSGLGLSGGLGEVAVSKLLHLCPPSAVRTVMKTRQALVIMKCLVYTSGSSHYTMSTQCLSCFSLSHSKSLGPGA